jgi:hypothetical protein
MERAFDGDDEPHNQLSLAEAKLIRHLESIDLSSKAKDPLATSFELAPIIHVFPSYLFSHGKSPPLSITIFFHLPTTKNSDGVAI